jgi:hypothetical protein
MSKLLDELKQIMNQMPDTQAMMKHTKEDSDLLLVTNFELPPIPLNLPQSHREEVEWLIKIGQKLELEKDTITPWELTEVMNCLMQIYQIQETGLSQLANLPVFVKQELADRGLSLECTLSVTEIIPGLTLTVQLKFQDKFSSYSVTRAQLRERGEEMLKRMAIHMVDKVTK